MKQNPPQKHHYIPEFYLKRWTTPPDNRLWQFSKPYETVVAERRFPSQTGFVKHLYSFDGATGDKAHRVEEFFFKPVDSGAADALRLMEKFGNNADWNMKQRSAWTRFLHSLLLRCPEDLEFLKKLWRAQILGDPTGEWEERYQKIRREGQPSTLKEALAGLTEEAISASTMRALITMIDNVSLGTKINNLPWCVLGTESARFDMLTSDRPIIRTNGLMADGGHLALPIGPRRLFIAGKDKDAIQRIISMDVNDLVRQVNEKVVTHAVRFVYGTSSGAKGFVKTRLSTIHLERLFESLARKREEIERASLGYFDRENEDEQD